MTPIALFIAMAQCLLPAGTPTRWNEPMGEYEPDDSPTPEHWEFSTSADDTYRIYSDGSLEEFDNREITLEELEARALNVLAALAHAHRIRKVTPPS